MLFVGMSLSVDPTRRIQDYEVLEEGKTVEVIYRHTWTGSQRRCTGVIVDIMGPRHDRSYSIEPMSAELTSITLHARHGSAGTVDGESVHEMAIAVDP